MSLNHKDALTDRVKIYIYYILLAFRTLRQSNMCAIAIGTQPSQSHIANTLFAVVYEAIEVCTLD